MSVHGQGQEPETAGRRSYMRAGDRRAQIIACARDVFAEQGFHRANIAHICQRARIARGTLYQYFDNKRDVLFAVVEEIAERVKQVVDTRAPIAALDGTVVATPPALIVAYCQKRLRALLDAVFEDEATLRLVLREARGLDGGVDRMVRRVDEAVLSALIRDLESARDLGLVACDAPELTALFVLGGVEKMVLSQLENDEPIDLDRIVETAIHLQLFGMLSARTRQGGRAHNDTDDEETRR